MDSTPINFLVLIIVPEAIATIFLGLYLIGVRPPITRVIIGGIIQGIIVFLVRKYTGYGESFLLQALTVIILIYTVVKVPFLCSVMASLIGTVISILANLIHIIIFFQLSKLSYIEILSRNGLLILFAAPKLIGLYILVGLCIKYKITLEEELKFLTKIDKNIRS